ncbi:MAG: hypothetical protein FDW93_03520 [Bergeyella sp.]|nr:hypothetical protein [Bergeyella sp.]
MKSLTFIGLVLLALATLIFYLIPNFSAEKIFEPGALMGILAGIGIGLIIGGIVGYISRGSAIKQAERRKEFKQLQKEKARLEKQSAELTKQQTEE